MHLLATTSGVIDGAAEAIDLKQSPGDIVILSRAMGIGYRNWLGYRGGLAAWHQAMSPMAGVGGQPPQMGPQQNPGQSGFGGGNFNE